MTGTSAPASLTGTGITRAPRDEPETVLSGMHRDGVAFIDGLAAPERMARLPAQLAEPFPETLGTGAEPDDHISVGDQRFAFPLPVAAPFDVEELLFDPALTGVLDTVLGDTWLFESIGVVIARPHAVDLRVHRDGNWLFGGTGIDKILPPVALTVAFALMDFDAAIGRTAFIPRSQREFEILKDPDLFISADQLAGSCCPWNFRMVHRAEQNTADQVRAMVCAAVCRPFCIDYENLRKEQQGRRLPRICGSHGGERPTTAAAGRTDRLIRLR
ncbi:phytanoyl-CoA dioxygenase family protein [Novosphingobium aquae]|uniref:Phytanoyl-CoA dioxygenase family protein n=1 Tax=Novosphingobium aquae TaxID=3133435 RepID=A0ABU8SA40_9SPHN